VKVGHLTGKMQTETTDRQQPDEIAHTLVTNVGEPVRVSLEGGRMTVPTEPCRGGAPATTTVALDCFDAVVERAAIEDGGLTLFCMDGLHLPGSEWRRSGLERHWWDDDADLESPFFTPQRRLEVWASREDALFDAAEPYDFSHLDDLPEGSPVLTKWAENATDEYPDRPPVPFERPTLSVRAVRAEGVTDVRGFDRVEVGRIARVDVLDGIGEEPAEPDVEPREVDVSLPSQHPEIDYDALEPLPHSEELLAALFTINRHAKRLGKEANAAYEYGRGAEARAHALRKRALYRTKTVVLHRLAKSDPDAVQVVRHELDGGHELFCLSLDEGYSFHQPLGAVEPALLAATTGNEDRSDLPLDTIDFEASSRTDDLDMSLSRAVAVLRNYDVEPNDYLDATRVEDFTWGSELSTTF
jgi:hypothetical protein